MTHNISYKSENLEINSPKKKQFKNYKTSKIIENKNQNLILYFNSKLKNLIQKCNKS